jgi:hypothetical protein
MPSRRAPWIRSDQRQLSLELETFLDAAEPPIYFGLGSMRAPQDVSQVIIQAARRSAAVQSCRVGGPA